MQVTPEMRASLHEAIDCLAGLQASMTEPPPTATLTVTPAVVEAGTGFTISWSTTNATSIVLNNGNVSPSGSLAVLGSAVGVHPHTLTATGPGGSVTKTATLTVNPALTATLNISPAVVQAGQVATVSWATTGATAVTLNGLTVALNGSTQVAAGVGSHVFTLVASGPNGSITRTVTLTVNA